MEKKTVYRNQPTEEQKKNEELTAKKELEKKVK
jgi:hypothetical protein